MPGWAIALQASLGVLGGRLWLAAWRTIYQRWERVRPGYYRWCFELGQRVSGRRRPSRAARERGLDDLLAYLGVGSPDDGARREGPWSRNADFVAGEKGHDAASGRPAIGHLTR